jgi:hypothetical protein
VLKPNAPVSFPGVAGNQATNAVLTAAARQTGSNSPNQGQPRSANTTVSGLFDRTVGEKNPVNAQKYSAIRVVPQSTTMASTMASSVRVSGATAAGVAREPKDPTQREPPGPTIKPEVPRKADDLAGPLPKEDAARVLQPGPEYWLSHWPDVKAMKPLRLLDEFNQVDEWIKRQTATTPDLARLEQVRDQLQSEKDRRQKQVGDDGKKMPQRAAKAAGKNRTTKTDDRAEAAVPRMLRERSTVATTEPGALQREYDEITAYLPYAAPGDRKLLQTELANLAPAVGQYLADRSAERHLQVIGRALTPDASSGDSNAQLVEAVRRVDSIKPISGRPGLSYLMHGHEMVVIPDAFADAIRAHTLKQLDHMASDIAYDNIEVQNDYWNQHHLSFDEHPVVGFISAWESGENPGDWYDTLIRNVWASNNAQGQFNKLRQASKDPWSTDRPNLSAMAERVAAAQRLSDNARNYLDYKKGQLLSGTATAVRSLERLKTAGQIAASVAFSPAGAALYGATESTLEQTSEIAYGQRKGYDLGGIAIDAGASFFGGKFGGFVGGKLGTGVLSLGGKSAPAWLRGIAKLTGVVGGGRAGAAATTGIEGVVNRITGRSDASASEIAGGIGRELVDVKGSGLDLAVGGFGHAVSSRARPSTSLLGRKLLVQPPPNRVPAAASTASAAEAGKTSVPAGPADAAAARVQSPQTAEAQMRPPAEVTPAASAAGKTRPTSRSTATRLGTRVLEAVIRGKLLGDPAIRGVPGGDFKPTPALVEGRSPKAATLSPAATPEASPPPLPAAERSASIPAGVEPATTPKVTPATKTPPTVTPPATESAAALPKTREWRDFLPKAREITARAKATYADMVMMAGAKPVGSPGGTSEAVPSAKGKRDPNTVSGKDPLVVAFVAGKRKGAYWPEGTPEFATYAGSRSKPPDRRAVVLPSKAAEDLGFRLAGTEREASIIPRTDEQGRQLESLGAGRTAKHNITARTSRDTSSRKGGGKLDPFEAKKLDPIAASAFHRTIAADRAGAHGYNVLLNNKEIGGLQEIGILRPGNISTGGVDAITAEVKDGKAKIFLNDFTTPDQPKPAKKSHEKWAAELGVAAATERLKTGNEEHDNAIAQAIKDGDIYVRAVRVDLSPEVRTKDGKSELVSGGSRVEVGDPVKVSRRAVAKAQAAKRKADREAEAAQRRADKAAAGSRRSSPTASKTTAPQRLKPSLAVEPKPAVQSETRKTSAASTPSAGQKIETRQKNVPARSSQIKAETAVPKTVEPVERDPSPAPIKDDGPTHVDPSSARGDRITEALGEPDVVLSAVRDYQQYKAEGRSEAEALSRSATTLAANLAGGPAGNLVNTGNPDQLLPATKQVIKDKWNKLWS